MFTEDQIRYLHIDIARCLKIEKGSARPESHKKTAARFGAGRTVLASGPEDSSSISTTINTD